MMKKPGNTRGQESGLSTRPTRRQSGFTLVEMSIVIMIMGLIVAGLAMPLATQRENARLRDARDQLDALQSALIGFALVNGSLPCPATPASSGAAVSSGGSCSVQHGFVPATTLGLVGNRNADNLLLDPWAAPVRYSVSDSDVDGDGIWDFTTPGELRDVGLTQLSPDLAICSSGVGASPITCGGAATTLSADAPAVLYSIGKDWPSFSSPDQVENVGSSLGGGPSGASYPVAANPVFVVRGRSDRPGEEFDDVVVWISANQLYHSLVMAGQLP